MEIAIIGGGITGLTTALALQKLGFSCKVYEQAPQLNEVGAGIWMQPNAMKVLDWLGIGDEIRNAGMLLENAVITNQKLIPLRKPNTQFVTDKKGNKITSIHRAKLQDVLYNSLPNETVFLGHEYQGHTIENDKVNINFQNKTIQTNILLGADGVHSKVRNQLFPDATIRYSGQTCWRGISDIALPENLKAFGHEAWGSQIRFGFANVAENKVYWFAVVKAPKGQAGPSNLKQHLLNSFEKFANPVPEIIRNTPDEKILHNDIIDLNRIDRWSKNRVCLLGDAAHATTPNMGQGACQGVEDAYYFSNILTQNSDYKKAFDQFEKERRKKVDYVVKTSWQFGKMAHSTIGQFFLKLAIKLTPEKTMITQMNELYSIKAHFD